MIFTVAFFFNIAGNFAFGVAMGALLGPAEFGRFATVTLAAIVLGAALFDWLRHAALRFSGDEGQRVRTASNLDAAYLAMMALLLAGFGALALGGARFGLSPTLLALTPLLAIAGNRVEYAAVLLRVRERPVAYAALYGLRQLLAFTLVVGVAYRTRDSGATICALIVACLIPALAVGAALRTPGARLADASRASLAQFFVYAKPIVAALAIYQVIALVNRQVALEVLGADATGRLSLATDMGQRLFQAFNTLPELMLFQYALSRERKEGVASAEAQLAVNSTLVLALLAPMAAGYMVMASTFEALMVPVAYRGDFAGLAWDLTPGFLAFYAISSTLSPALQLAKRTWPLTIPALVALAADLALLKFGGAAQDVHALARAYSISLAVGYLATAAVALRSPAVRPKARDIGVIAASTLAMALAVRPLNGLGHPALGAALALALGGLVYGGPILWFDVAGLRSLARKRIAGSLSRGAAPQPRSLPGASSGGSLQ